jgi:hypothetical protein
LPLHLVNIHLINVHLVNIHLINVTSNVYSTSAMTKQPTDKQLRRLYRENWDVFTEAMEAGTSAPLLLSASETYREADQRLFFVGQETAGWDHPSDTDDPVGKLMKRYRAFRFGEDGLRHTPFWRAVHEVREEVNPESSDASILWSKTHLHDVTCPALPEQSFRTYHPRYLQQDKQWDLLETLSTQLKEN